ncbi:acyltransferase [Flavobacterium paronense]|uniref:Acyltransferase n=1 Tax=Flavobacterium paronense TaxID=1392775 RepID=A0ABV5GAQ0_9FLAO|nr:acyltransferase [Flavobacterium paronense]MDN3676672.1 acyltransferase [Flavobacterium paronense]
MFLDKYKYKNWKKPEPSNVIEYLLSPALFNLTIVNFFFQKILRINAEVPFMVHFTSRVSKTIFIGRGVAEYFANSGGCYIQGINKVYIGDYTIFAPGVKIISANHDKKDFKKHDKSIGPIVIGKKCWLGANSVILPGVHLGDNVIVAAGAVVTKSFPSNVVLGGVPAKIIGKNE